jgi:hypothetical protein
MATLTAKQRKRVPKADFGIPGKDEYPMEDRKHTGDAKARAKDALDAGHISQATYDHIVAMANKKLGETPKGAGH